MKKQILVTVNEVTFKKLLKKKREDGFQDRDWGEWLSWLAKDVRLEDTYRDKIQKATAENLLDLWMQNYAVNVSEMIKPDALTIADLVPPEVSKEPNRPHGSAIVVGAGPSVWERNHLKLLAESNYDGMIISTDRMLIPCLQHDIIPDLTITVDGNREKIVEWYNNSLVDEYGEKIKAALSTNVAPNVVERLKKAKAKIYWFHPIFDDWRTPESFTRLMKAMTKTEKNPHGVPCMTCGGNSGTTCWVIAHALFRRSPVALIGLNFGYLGNSPLEHTQYFEAMVKETGNIDLAKQIGYREVYNPHEGKTYLTDLVFHYYKEGFLDMVKRTPEWVETYNATEGGILFGSGIYWIKLKDFLAHHKDPETLRSLAKGG